MKILVILAAAAALAVPAAALADDAPTSTSDLASQSCKQQQTQLGATFKLTYANFGACVSKANQAAQGELRNAAKQCKAERAADAAAFQAKYAPTADAKGKSGGANAYGKCVSQQAKAEASADAKEIVSAAKQCKTARTADRTAFATKYGSKRNAFGKCVSALTNAG